MSLPVYISQLKDVDAGFTTVKPILIGLYGRVFKNISLMFLLYGYKIIYLISGVSLR